MKKFITCVAFCVATLTAVAQQSNSKVIFKFNKMLPTDTVFTYINGDRGYDTLTFNAKGECTKSYEVKEYTDLLIFYGNKTSKQFGRQQAILVGNNTLKVTLNKVKVGTDSTAIKATFAGDDPYISIYANTYYDIFNNEGAPLGGSAYAKINSYKECKAYAVKEAAPLKAILKKIKNNDFKKQAGENLDMSIEAFSSNYAVEAEKSGKKMEQDKDYMDYIASINMNDTTKANEVTRYLSWYDAAHPDAYAPLKDIAAQLKHMGTKVSNQRMRNIIVSNYMQSLMWYFSFGVSPTDTEWKDVYEQVVDLSTDSSYVKFAKEQLDAMKKSAAGLPAVDFTVNDAQDKAFSFKELVSKGKVTYIDFWATWCGPCKREIPAFAKLAEAYKDNKNIEFISISIDANVNDWKNMLKSQAHDWPQYIIPDAAQCEGIKVYNINSIPRFMLFDKKGNLYKGNAPRPSEESIKAMLDEVINQ